MKTIVKLATALTLTATLAAAVLADASQDQHQLLLNVDFSPREVAQVEVGDFHFLPGQIAPVHTHVAPAIGYVSKGTIYYQVEGMPAQVLKAGDAFYEPVGPRILHFDNASTTEEAVFTDFNLEQVGEPFIVFPKPLTEKIDRRSFPTVQVGGSLVSKAVSYADTIARGGTLKQKLTEPVVGYVAQGNITLQLGDGAPQSLSVGQSYNAPAGSTLQLSAVNSKAKVVSFYLRK